MRPTWLLSHFHTMLYFSWCHLYQEDFWCLLIYNLQSVVCSLQSAVCSLQSAVCKCHTPVLWTLKLTQSQVGIVGLKIVNSLNRINHRIKFRKRNRFYLLDFCCIFYRFVDFLTLNTLTQLYLKKPIHISDQYCFQKLPNNQRFGAYRNWHLVVLRSGVTFFRPFLV